MTRHVSSDFRTHWQTNNLTEVSITKKIEAKQFLHPLLTRLQNAVDTMHILDVGCGDGVHAVALAEAGLGKHYCYGLDLSPEAVRLAEARIRTTADKNISFQVGNVLTLPYHEASFDNVFSYGVLAYTGDPERVLDEMIRVCKPGGLVSIWLYPKSDGLGGRLFGLTRNICRRLGRQFSKPIIYTIALLLPILPVRSGINLFNATWQQCVEVVEVNLLPQVLDFYTLDEVLTWFRSRNLTIEFIDEDRPITIWARI